MMIQISSGQGPAECELAVAKLYTTLKKEYKDIEILSSHPARSAQAEGFSSILFKTEADLSALEGSVLWICRSPYRPHHRRKNWYVDVSIIPERDRVTPFLSGKHDIIYRDLSFIQKKEKVTGLRSSKQNNSYGNTDFTQKKEEVTGLRSSKQNNSYGNIGFIREKDKREGALADTYHYNKEEIRFEKFHCGGKGGQHVNKAETGVRLIHLPTGITVTATEERSQYQNKRTALAKLHAILQEQEVQARQKQVNDAWKEHSQIVRGDPVRTYVGMEFKRR